MEQVEGQVVEQPVNDEPLENDGGSLDSREADIIMRENTLVVREAFSSVGIPESLIPLVVNKDIEIQKKNMNIMVKEWNSALKSAITEKIKGKAPEISDEQPSKKWSEMTYYEKVQLKRSNPALYEAAKNQRL